MSDYATTHFPRRRFSLLLFLCWAGILLCLMFVGDLLPSKRALVILMTLTTIFAIKLSPTRHAPFALMPRLMIAIYVLPFSITIGFLFDQDFTWLTGTARSVAVSNDGLVREMLSMGLVGLVGLFAGIVASSFGMVRKQSTKQKSSVIRGTLGLPLFAVLLSAALLLCQLSTPPETVLDAAYATGQSASAARSVNFPAASMLGYGVMIVLLLDLLSEPTATRRMPKVVLWLVALGVILLVFQILRGDRDSANLVAAATLVYLSWSKPDAPYSDRARVFRSRIRSIALPATLLIVVFLGLGAVRSDLARVGARAVVADPMATIRLGYEHSTWTAILLTNLAMSQLYDSQEVDYRCGRTYVDYALSLMPGLVAKQIGYERPLESWQGPAFDLQETFPTGGGIHVVLVPFWNFGIFGSFLVMCLYGYVIGRAEMISQGNGFWPRLVWAGLALSSFRWFWYGDMAFVRAMMAIAVAGLVYAVAIMVRSRPAQIVAQTPEAGGQK